MRDGYIAWRYGLGLLSTLIAAGFGVWVIAQGVREDSLSFMGLLHVPRWVLLTIGALLQVPLIIYLIVGFSTSALHSLVP